MAGYIVPMILLVLYMGLMGGMYGAVINSVSPDTYNKVKGIFQTVMIISFVLLALFTTLALYYITAEPAVFPKFAIIMMSSSMLLSLLSVSFSVLQVVN